MVPVLVLLMVALVAADEPIMDLSEPAESDSVLNRDSSNTCPAGTTYCSRPFGVWFCCPFPMGNCCREGTQCCERGYPCDPTSSHCTRGFISTPKLDIKAIQTPQTEKFHCDGDVYCPTELFCCKSANGQWGCCNEMVL